MQRWSFVWHRSTGAQAWQVKEVCNDARYALIVSEVMIINHFCVLHAKLFIPLRAETSLKQCQSRGEMRGNWCGRTSILAGKRSHAQHEAQDDERTDGGQEVNRQYWWYSCKRVHFQSASVFVCFRRSEPVHVNYLPNSSCELGSVVWQKTIGPWNPEQKKVNTSTQIADILTKDSLTR